jgi:hypothetical protein
MDATLYVIGLTVLRLGVPMLILLSIGTVLHRRTAHWM